MLVSFGSLADIRSSADYEVVAETSVQSGDRIKSADYTADVSLGVFAGLSTSDVPQQLKQGYAGQLYDLVSYEVIVDPTTFVSNDTRDLLGLYTYDDDTIYSWYQLTQYYLSLTAGGGDILGATQGWKNAGWMYDLVPTNAYGFLFDAWETNGAPAGTTIPLHIVMDHRQAVVAYFVADFLNVTDETASDFTDWELNRMTGTMFGQLEICNTNPVGKPLQEIFWYAVGATDEIYLMDPDGVTTDGLDYVDISAEVVAALPSVGDGDLSLEPGECVTIDGIEFYSRYRQPPEGHVFAVWADPPAVYDLDMASWDTDRDGMPNGWEDAQFLEKHDPADGAFDSDGDGMLNREEYVADTDPRDSISVLRLNLRHVAGSSELDWVGGVNATQYLLRATAPEGPWECIYTNQPPTAASEWLEYIEPASGAFYRIRVGR